MSDEIIEKTLTSVLRQKEQHNQTKIMANIGPYVRGYKMIKKPSLNQNGGKNSECIMVRF